MITMISTFRLNQNHSRHIYILNMNIYFNIWWFWRFLMNSIWMLVWMLKSLKCLKKHLLLKEMLLVLVVAWLHKTWHDVYRDREDNGAIILCGYAIECLEISQLKKTNFTNYFSRRLMFFQMDIFNLFHNLFICMTNDGEI